MNKLAFHGNLLCNKAKFRYRELRLKFNVSLCESKFLLNDVDPIVWTRQPPKPQPEFSLFLKNFAVFRWLMLLFCHF